MAIVTIVGAGLMGTATAWPLSHNGHTVRLVGTHLDGEIITSCKEKRYYPRLKRELPPGVRPYSVEETAAALDGAEIVLSGVNSLGVRWLAYGLPGAGDMYVTCAGGRTTRLGALLGKGHSMTEAREIMAGVTLESAEIVRVMGHALPRLVQRGALKTDELPLMRALVDVVVHGRPVEVLLDAFFGGTGKV
jgi:glycerol-3-phosphate dehydrogenase